MHTARPDHEAGGRVEGASAIKVATNNAKYSPGQDTRQLVASQSKLCYLVRWPEWPGTFRERYILIVAAAHRGLSTYPLASYALLLFTAVGTWPTDVEPAAKCCAIEIDVQ